MNHDKDGELMMNRRCLVLKIGARHESMSGGCVKMDFRLEWKNSIEMRIRWGHLCWSVYEADFDVSQLVEHFTAMMMISVQACAYMCALAWWVELGWGLD